MRSLLRRLAPDLACLALLALLPLVFFFPVTLGGRTLLPIDNLYQLEPWASHRVEQGVPEVPHNALLSDLILQNYAWKTFLRESLAAGELPLWQPNQFAGTPFLANGQHSALYPFSLLMLVLPLPVAYGWFTVSQLALAGALMFLLVRGLGLSRAAGVVSGVSYQLSGFFITATVHPMIQAGAAWLPLILLMVEYILQGRALFPASAQAAGLRRLPWVLIGALALGMSFLAGHVEITYYTLLVTALYAVLRGMSLLYAGQWRPLGPAAASVALLVGLGFGLGAAQFLPFLETANASFRTERSSLAEVRGFALPERHLLVWAMPNVFGNPAHIPPLTL
ncbi:MAG: YfhO family protein, partial [Anaerolineae bacterium]|nr:YfhO family protein [Anaerolineae bacterium]